MKSASNQRRLGLVLVGVLVLVAALLRWRCTAEQEPSHASADERAGARHELTKSSRIAAPEEPQWASVSGVVVARGGSPLAGARVCAIADTVQSRGRVEKPRCVLSDAAGQYRIDKLLPVRTRIHASAARHRPTHWRSLDADGRVQDWLTLEDGREHDNVDITLEPGGVRLAGFVHDLAGGSIEGAFVSAARDTFGEPQDLALALSDAEGRFELWVAPGSVRVEAWAEGYTRAQRRHVAPSEHVELFLVPESVVIGRVVDASTGAPVSGAEVWAGRHRSHRFDSGPQLDGPLQRTDEQGRFRIGGLEPGMYKPGAVIDDRYGQAPELVHLGLGQTSAEIEIRVHALARVVGQVRVAETDQPCPEPGVHLQGPDGIRRARVLADGHVELLGLQPGSYQVMVRCAGFVPEPEYEPIEIAGASPPPRVWDVHVGANLRGVVEDARGQPLAGMRVHGFSLGQSLTRSIPGATQPTDDAGQFTILGVAPGRYELWAGGEAGRSETIEFEVRGTDELTDLRLVVTEGGSLRGRVLTSDGEPRPQVEITVERSDDRRGSARAHSNDQGEFEIAWLEPGPYRVAAAGESNHEEVQIHTGEQAQVELVVATHDGVITGRVYDIDGAPVSDAFVGALVMRDPAEVPLARQRAAALARSDWSTITEPSLTDVDGRFAISKLAPGEYIVYAHRKGGGTAVVDSVALGSEVSLQLSVTGSLAGTVALPDGTRPQSFEITLSALDQGFMRRDDFLRTDGAWAFHELPAGRLRVQVEAPEGTATTELTLGEGEARELELILQGRVTVTGRIVALDTNEPLARISVTGSGIGAKPVHDGLSDAQGRFQVVVPSGEITLFIYPQGGTAGSPYQGLMVPRSIPDDSSTHDLGDIGLLAGRLADRQRPGDLGFELEVPPATTDPSARRAKLALVRPGGPAAAAGLEVGDVIEQVDGKSVVGRDFDRFGTLTRVPAGTVLSLELADGDTVALSVGPPQP